MTVVASGTVVQQAALVSPWRDAWRRYRRHHLAFGGGIVAALILLVALLAPLIAPYSYVTSDLAATLQPPSAHHLLGTDAIGRDLLSRLIYGARTSMTVGFLVPCIGLLIGLPIGAAAGWLGGWVDVLVQRLIEAMTAVPSILLALLLVTLYGSGLTKVTLFLGLTGWLGMARLVRAQFFALRDRDFVKAARAMGTPGWRIVLFHIMPNAAGPLIILFVLSVPGAVFGEAGLSFLGLGVQDPIPSWGKMIAENANYVQLDPALILLPILCIILTVLSFSFVGDGLRDVVDPTSVQ